MNDVREIITALQKLLDERDEMMREIAVLRTEVARAQKKAVDYGRALVDITRRILIAKKGEESPAKAVAPIVVPAPETDDPDAWLASIFGDEDEK